jgi:hypothetical protein
MMSDALMREMMRAKAAAKKDPEFHETQTELVHALTWANTMREAGRLTKKEFQEFESHLAAEYLSAMPTEMFVEMQKDGRYADIEIIASHDGKRDGHSVLQDRKKLSARIKADALDEFFAAQKIDSKRYAEEHKNLGTFDDDRVRRINDADDNGDGDAVALDIFFERNLPPDPEPEPGKAPRPPQSITSPAEPEPDRVKSADED